MATDGYRCCVCEERVQVTADGKAHEHKRQVDAGKPKLGTEICAGSRRVPFTWQKGGGWGRTYPMGSE